jgi:hypothetical protein
MMNLTTRQIECRDKIKRIAIAMGVDPAWAISIAMVESSLGEAQVSPTGCRGVFQMSSVAMKDLLQEMEKQDDDIADIGCGLAFLNLLRNRHGSIEKATEAFCAPKDRGFYVPKVLGYMKIFQQ